MKVRVHLHSTPGMWATYDGHVDVWVEDEHDAFRAAVRELGRAAAAYQYADSMLRARRT